jgi:hypothetical protein
MMKNANIVLKANETDPNGKCYSEEILKLIAKNNPKVASFDDKIKSLVITEYAYSIMNHGLIAVNRIR